MSEIKEQSNYRVNDQLKQDLGKREIAFEYQGDETENIIYVFKTPNMGQLNTLMDLSDPSINAREKSKTAVRVFKELVKLPSPEEFEQIYYTLFNDEVADFSARFIAAMEAKRKK